MPVFSFIILTYNSERYIDPFFEGLLEQVGEEIKKGTYEVIVADNASADTTEKKVSKYVAQNIYFVQNGFNAGYAKGINLAVKKAKGEYIVIVNPDAKLVKEDFEKIHEFFSTHSKAAIAGLKIINFQDKNELNAGSFFNPLTFLIFALGFENLFGLRFSPDTEKQVDFVSGGFVIFRKSHFEALHGYDEDYFMYVEDMDICFRAKKAGYSVWFLPYATLKHHGQGSSNREFAIVNIYKGLITFYRKNASESMLSYVRNLLRLKATIIIFVGSITGNKEVVATYSKALKTLR